MTTIHFPNCWICGRAVSLGNSLGSARIVLCRKEGAGKGTIPPEHSRKGGTIPAKHAAKADYLSLWRNREPGIVCAKSRLHSSSQRRGLEFSWLQRDQDYTDDDEERSRSQ